ncbi:MAG: alkaline phosphatase family protein [Desulfobaccales bacterium]
MNKTVLIGLDGATWSILDPLMAEGHMPFLRKFLSKAFRADLLSTPNPLTPPAWVSMVTGRSPGNHGVFDFIRSEARNGNIYFTLYNSTDILCETVWSMASRQGHKVIHLNFPMMAPPQPVDGYVIPSMVQWRHLKRNIHPKSLYDKIAAIPDFQADQWALTYCEANEAMRHRALFPDEEEEKAWVVKNLQRDKQWFIILKYLMEHDPADLTAIVFDGVDKLLHPYWRLVDPNTAVDRLPDWEKRLRGQVLEYFLQLDSYIRDIVHLAGDDAHIIMASDHGFGPARYVFHVNVLLERLGYLGWREVHHATVKKHNHEWSFASLDWSKTTAYAGTPSSNGINIRMPNRQDDNGAAYEAFRARLREQLLEYRDPVTGEQIVTRAITREEAFPGGAMPQAPDLTVTLSDHSFVSVINEEPIVLHRPEINGTHRPEGIFALGGPGVRSGANPDPFSILDVAPTLLYCLGVPIPKELEGRVPVEAWEESYLQTHRIGDQDTAAFSASERAESPFSDEEEKAIWAQLQTLGYVE